MPTSATIALDRFDALTFDCYGTLIDWETGLLAAYRRVLAAHNIEPSADGLLSAHARHETALEAGPYRSYRDVLAGTLTGVARELGFAPSRDETTLFAGSVADWPAFADSAASLAVLARHFRLGVITNCDDDLFEASRRRLRAQFECVVTAQQARSYKPAARNFELALDGLGLPVERVLHVAQSLFHDHVPAKRLGLATAWIDRRHGQAGFGATPAAEAQPDLTLPDLASLAALAKGAAAAHGGVS